MSQRELAEAVGTSAPTIAKVETGAMTPSIALFGRVLGVAGLHLVVVDSDARVVQPMDDWDDLCDGAGRRYPSHLDTIVDPVAGEWWADIYGLVRPPETFRRDRASRDMQRARSQWEVRVAKYRSVPPPPYPPDWFS
jgi:transcriptional regulator with XRE-family HTH domain